MTEYEKLLKAKRDDEERRIQDLAFKMGDGSPMGQPNHYIEARKGSAGVNYTPAYTQGMSWFNKGTPPAPQVQQNATAAFVAGPGHGLTQQQLLETTRLGPGAQEGIQPTAGQNNLLKYYTDTRKRIDEMARLKAEGSAANAARQKYGAMGGAGDVSALDTGEDNTDYNGPFSLFHPSTWGNGTAPAAGAAAPGQAPAVIERKVGNRIALYDSKTKKPLGWKK